MFNKLKILIPIFLIINFSSIYARDIDKKDSDKGLLDDLNKSDSYYFKQFQEVFEKVKRDYMQVPNRQELVDEAINGMLKSLDPYSGYYTDENYEFFVSDTQGKFGGIGVEITYDMGVIKIISPIDDLPAHKAGIKAGDYIVGINGQLVSNLGFNKSVKNMRGEPGSKLNLLVVQNEKNETKEVELTRELVKIKPVKYEIIEEDSIAYIRLVAFNAQTSIELKKAFEDIISKLKKDKKILKGIIIDLRNNAGGLLEEAVSIAEFFIDQGIIVSVKGRDSKNDQLISASKFATKAPKVPMVVLINSGSASASEILAGALQDHKRAILLGTTSYGKGLVQTFIPVSKRSAVMFTTAKYYTPNNRSINAIGIEPDIYIENAKVEYPEKVEKNKNFTSTSIKSYLKKYNIEDNSQEIKEKEVKKEYIMPEKYKNDYQYARAVDLIKGLIVTGSKFESK